MPRPAQVDVEPAPVEAGHAGGVDDEVAVLRDEDEVPIGPAGRAGPRPRRVAHHDDSPAGVAHHLGRPGQGGQHLLGADRPGREPALGADHHQPHTTGVETPVVGPGVRVGALDPGAAR